MRTTDLLLAWFLCVSVLAATNSSGKPALQLRRVVPQEARVCTFAGMSFGYLAFNAILAAALYHHASKQPSSGSYIPTPPLFGAGLFAANTVNSALNEFYRDFRECMGAVLFNPDYAIVKLP